MQGRDLIPRAKTGTGKTLAFGLPVLDKLTREKDSVQYRPAGTPQAIILAPTRELAKQVENELEMAAPHLSVVCIYGGVSIEGQRRQLQYSVDLLVGTPGRVIDMFQRGDLRLNDVKYAILDEADQMLAVDFGRENHGATSFSTAVHAVLCYNAYLDQEFFKEISNKSSRDRPGW